MYRIAIYDEVGQESGSAVLDGDHWEGDGILEAVLAAADDLAKDDYRPADGDPSAHRAVRVSEILGGKVTDRPQPILKSDTDIVY
jgi:hypothetical protein